ncbi:MAG TPA: RNA 2',3'-cyclic phosphodiesterase [Caldilineaceae bacterium]|nr:RNA 2',3'-cyclic phosphodiesterase [Caldilineaceae bacterium]
MAGADSNLRTFIAIELPPAVQTAIAEEQARIQAHLRQAGAPNILRWTAPGNVHLTLRFLGDTTPTQRRHIIAGLQRAAPAWPVVALAVGGLGCFPNLRALRVVWLGLEGERAALDAIQAQVEALVQEAGFPAEERSFSPHLTVARVRKEASRAEVQRTGQALAAYIAQRPTSLLAGPFSVDHLVYFRSDLRPSGSLYTPLATVQIGGATPQPPATPPR